MPTQSDLLSSLFSSLNLRLLIFCLIVLKSPLALSEFWLSDRLYLQNQQFTSLEQPITTDDNDLSWQGISQLNLNQGLEFGKLQLGSKLAFSNQTTDAVINQANLVFAIPQLTQWTFTLGRQTISYSQQDLFNKSLSKNHSSLTRLHPQNSRNYSQGFLINHRLGFIQQQLLLNQDNNQPSYHYQLTVGIPGYIVGPITLVVEYLPSFQQADSEVQQYQYQQQPLLTMLGSAIQFPMPNLFAMNLKGDWQWAFQFGRLDHLSSQKNGSLTTQQAWQSSLSWLGFIPRHKLGLLVSHTDKGWVYSDDFSNQQDSLELRYQVTLAKGQVIELALNRSEQPQLNHNPRLGLRLGLNFSF